MPVGDIDLKPIDEVDVDCVTSWSNRESVVLLMLPCQRLSKHWRPNAVHAWGRLRGLKAVDEAAR